MSKQHMAGLVLRKGHAAPATNQESLEPRKEEFISQGRRRPWHGEGMDDTEKVNFEIPRRVIEKMNTLKGWRKIRYLKDFVGTALEKEADKLIAQAEKEGF